MEFQDFRDFPVYQKAFRLLLDVYAITKEYPPDERFGLTSDSNRSANSVVHNIAEGFGRYEKKDKSRFYKFSRASAYEIMSQILVGAELKYFSSKRGNELIAGYKDVIHELDRLIHAVENRQ